MKYGILNFSYENAKNFERSVADPRFLLDQSSTLCKHPQHEDYTQKIGIDDAEIVSIDRDRLASYQGEPVGPPHEHGFLSLEFFTS